jgi:hypothetical protein
VIELTSETAGPIEEVELFSIDGIVYTMPAKVGTNVSLQYLRMVRTQGQEVALGWLLERVIGEDAYEALMNCDGLTPDALAQVMEVVRQHTMGAVEAPKGSSKRG